MMAVIASLLLLASGASAGVGVPVRAAIGDLHGFPSMSDASGNVIATGELRQQRRGRRLTVHATWRFRDGLVAEERDEFEVGAELAQTRFSWIERRAGTEQRRFEVDFETGRALARVERPGDRSRDESHLELPRGRAFAGYGTALAVSELPLDTAGAKAELTFVGFAPKPRAISLEVRRDGEEQIPAAGRQIPSVRFTLHPKLPFAIRVLVHVEDARLWFTDESPRALVRAEQNLVTKDDPRVVIDVIPRAAPRRARQGSTR
jgi:hypothetical protein